MKTESEISEGMKSNSFESTLKGASATLLWYAAGWFLFIVGFFLGAIPWYIGAFLLLCVRMEYREKPGLIACTLASILEHIEVKRLGYHFERVSKRVSFIPCITSSCQPKQNPTSNSSRTKLKQAVSGSMKASNAICSRRLVVANRMTINGTIRRILVFVEILCFRCKDL
ncbi:uncharacterized protein LOC116031494 [Ipomoea triloba]|uniref:uncharacterized protein LOC116031494 n=1 Tax=Ipomoea triloba TaxID=35885 RepID=UPI00125DCFEA|nr:uncharacterized protein LOC116031494 [Ipomoea triloba]